MNRSTCAALSPPAHRVSRLSGRHASASPGPASHLRRIALLAGAISLAACGRLPAQDEDAATAASSTSESAQSQLERLRGIRQSIRTLEAERVNERRELQEGLRDLAAEERSVGQTLESLRRKLDKLKEQRDAKRAEIDKLRGETAEKHAASQVLVERTSTFLEEVVARIAKDIPWNREERIAAIERTRKSLIPAIEKERKNVSPGAALAAASRVQKEEEAQARLVEQSAVNLKTSDGTLNVQAFHLGLLAVVFASEDGTVLGYAGAGQKLEDGLETVAGKPEAADGYLRAVDILRRRRTPDIVELYFPSMPEGRKGSKGASSQKGGSR